MSILTKISCLKFGSLNFTGTLSYLQTPSSDTPTSFFLLGMAVGSCKNKNNFALSNTFISPFAVFEQVLKKRLTEDAVAFRFSRPVSSSKIKGIVKIKQKIRQHPLPLLNVTIFNKKVDLCIHF